MQIIPTKKFNDDVEFYIRKKKFLKIRADIKTVTDELEKGNLVGDRLEGLDLPENISVYKVRIANRSANVGKSHGFRLLYYVAIADEIYLVSIYSKKDDIRVPSDKQVEFLIRAVLEEKKSEEE
ncbi:MAG: hypothetical protein II968_03385 [Selenomonadaceae bacterium]|nr:hypothetical protein [Selenomonadaceae bacterium]